MTIDSKSAQASIRRLRETMKQLEKDAVPEKVHTLRTDTRRVEAIMDVLGLQKKKHVVSLLENLKPVRKMSGRVRDLDVFIGNLLNFADGENEPGQVKLIEQLSLERAKAAARLFRLVNETEHDVRKDLKWLAAQEKFASKNRSKNKSGLSNSSTRMAGATETALDALSSSNSPTAKNIHHYRIKVKHLRYILQLALKPDDALIDALGEVKDKVGGWHDWAKLHTRATKLLDRSEDRMLLKQMADEEKMKFKDAIASIRHLRYSVLKKESASRV